MPLLLHPKCLKKQETSRHNETSVEPHRMMVHEMDREQIDDHR
jgi:hypothetical protein